MKQVDDNQCIELILEGNTAAFSVLVERHKQMVFSIALKIVQNREEAEEVAQDSFVKAFESLASFEKKAKFTTWLYRITYNAAISRTRKKRVDCCPLNDSLVYQYAEDTVDQTIKGLNEIEQKQMIDKALSQLPEEDNLLIHLYYYAGHSVSEIGTITGLKESNTKVRLHRIRQKLYGLLSEMMLVQSV